MKELQYNKKEGFQYNLNNKKIISAFNHSTRLDKEYRLPIYGLSNDIHKKYFIVYIVYIDWEPIRIIIKQSNDKNRINKFYKDLSDRFNLSKNKGSGFNILVHRLY